MSFLSNLTDRLVLQASTHFIDPEERERRLIPSVPNGGQDIEAWVTRSDSDSADKTPVSILKFPGTAGRAERAGIHPAEIWTDIAAEVWTINHRGYGGSPGPASLANFAETCESAWKALSQEYPDRKIVVYGNSLGCLSALYLSARYPVAGAYLRNPPALAQMIATRRRYAWWNFGASSLIANQIPPELDSIKNASRSTCPALFIQSALDRVIPPQFQNDVIEQFKGKSRKFVIHGADHHHGIDEGQQAEYTEAVQWLEQQLR